MLSLVIFIIFIALTFDFYNGFHDAANSIATVVSTRVLTPLQAVIWAAFFNFVAAFGFGVKVARTMGSGMVEVGTINEYVIMAGLCGAIIWLAITLHYGIPVSSSHALIGGYAGAAVTHAGFQALILSGWINPLLFIVLSPTIGLILAFSFMVIVSWLFRRFSPGRIDKYFRKLQLLSAAAYSLGHGTNDAQKTMGIIAGLLYTSGYLQKFEIPFWVVLMCHAAIALGTLMGGWKIVKTLGSKVTKLQPVGGFCAETAGAVTIIGSALAGIPVSTTHTITGAIIGVGATRRLSAVRWGVAARIVWAWILTIPFSAFFATLIYLVIQAVR